MALIGDDRCHLGLPQDEMAMLARTFLKCEWLFLEKG